MSESKKKTNDFLKNHPYCCYCGGATPATTIDHNPPRALFVNRQSPDRYQFPACFKCNNGKSSTEGIFAFLCQLGGTHKRASGHHANSSEKHYQAVARRFPEATLNKINFISANQARKIDSISGLSRLPGQTYSGSALFKIDAPEFKAALESGFSALIIALFYKHTGRVLPSHGVVAFKYFTNTQHKTVEHLFNSLSFNLTRSARPAYHHTTPLEEQFSYTWFQHPDGQFLCFWIRIHNTFSILSLAGDAPIDWGASLDNFCIISPASP